ncbi:hypothetical protein [Ornatilinea apprima]|uniref:hypothetical protein n=1 Tax=Ornatilinea apprima TaxID=1134406 RepID=UPI00128EA80B|nr:hypothetical protein [Ornatilinea apprima]
MEESRLNIVTYLWKERFLPVMLFNGFVYAITSLLLPVPQVVIPVGFFLGYINILVMNSVQPRNPLKPRSPFLRILKIILVTLLGSLLGVLFLRGACLTLKNPVCSPNSLRATIFAIFAFVQIAVIGISIETYFSKNTKLP